MKRIVIGTGLLLIAALALAGCATKKYVRGEVGAAEGRTAEQIDEVATDVEETQTGRAFIKRIQAQGT